MPDTVIAELPKGPLDKLVISLREYQGHGFVDNRLHFLGDDVVQRGLEVGAMGRGGFRNLVLQNRFPKILSDIRG